jgi:pyruvate/2-oxoglutarate dehydrogenase complex dihydrolipoamide dehydrogenase (E3) component
MSTVLKPDLCVIGAGAGGLSVAAGAAAFGVSVVLVERGRMGGDCLNVGCVPSKALIAASRHAQAIREASAFGLTVAAPQVRFDRVHAHVHRVIGTIAPVDSAERFRALGVTVLNGEAAFLDRSTVRVGDTEIKARRFVIATGSSPAIPAIEGLEAIPFLTNESVFDLTRRPAHLVVIGGGPIGVELGQAFRRLGGAVTILQSGRILPREDAEAAGAIRRALIADGVTLIENARVVAASGDAEAVSLTLDDGRAVTGSQLLIAAGRKPTLEALNLGAAAVATDARGAVVDKGLRTTNRRIYAIGDCASGAAEGLQFTHVANHHAGLVLRSALFRLPAKLDNRLIPRVTYADPEVAHVGLGEEQALAAGHAVRLLRWPFSENDRAQTERAKVGFVKIVADGKGRILGATVVGRHAGELITPWTIAVAKGWRTRDMMSFVVPYPTLSEASKRAALSDLAEWPTKPWIRRILAFLRALG